MDVILLKDVEKLGLRGEVVGVARGYARNFLLPRRLAEVATPAKVAEVARREQKRARHEASTLDEANKIVQTIEAAELRFDVAAGETGTLFGSVTPTDIADELWSSKKIRVDRRKIHLPETIKRVGWYTIPIDVFSGVTAELTTVVVPVGGEVPPKEAPPEPEPELVEEAVAEPAVEAVVAPEAPEAVLDPVEAVPEPEAIDEPEPDEEPEAVEEPEPPAAESPAAESPADEEPAVTDPGDDAPVEPIA
jgi:large subunit ribosomal protein L9